MFGKPQTDHYPNHPHTHRVPHTTNQAKPMEGIPLESEMDHAILAKLVQSPMLSGHFNDIDEIHDFFESLEPEELRIIIDSNDPKVVLEFRSKVQDDLNETSKQLAMDG